VIVFGHRFVTDESKYSKVIRVDPILIKKENFRQETQHTLGRKYKRTSPEERPATDPTQPSRRKQSC
jgi:hypothetical protein